MVVRHFHGTAISQTEIVNRAFGRTDCDTNPLYDRGIPLVRPLPSVQSVYLQWKVSTKHDEATIAFQQIKDEITATKPIQVIFWWNDGGAHAALLTGWMATAFENRVVVNDPQFGGPSLHTFASVVSGYGLGSWTDTLRFEKVS
jgi:hypothetical protein